MQPDSPAAAATPCGTFQAIYISLLLARLAYDALSPHPHARRGAAMALSKLSGDEQCIIFSKLCNALEPGVAVAFSSANSELREP
eukprot:scaffold9105_cov58-Phaeocystis_antarctica.AAC.1